MTRNKFGRIVRDAAGYTRDAVQPLRYKLTRERLLMIQVKLRAARIKIDLALDEIEARLEA